MKSSHQSTDGSIIDEILLIHHSHTDIGYTNDQPVVWEIHRRGIDRALELAERDLESNGPDAFHWTVETTGPFLYWLANATDDQIERFRTVECAGRIEVTALLTNATTLANPEELVESLEPVRKLRDEYGFDVRYAMNSDVNGQNWPLVDTLLDAGIEGFSMGINEHFGGAPERPLAFDWEGPSGRTLPTWNGFHYSIGHELVDADVERIRDYYWANVEKRLAEIDYPFDALPLQVLHPFGDNGPPDDSIPQLVREWNAQDDVDAGRLPRLRMATLSDWFAIVDGRSADLPVRRGDWTDYWTFGTASTARELAMHRENRRRLQTADAVEAAVGALDSDRPTHRRVPDDHRARAWWGHHFFNAHTWAPDTTARDPHGEDTRSQWNHKANYAYETRSVSAMMRRDALAELARRVDGEVVADE